MTAYHVLYIPAVLFFGIFLGITLGRDQIRREIAHREQREREREARRRELRDASSAAEGDDTRAPVAERPSSEPDAGS